MQCYQKFIEERLPMRSLLFLLSALLFVPCIHAMRGSATEYTEVPFLGRTTQRECKLARYFPEEKKVEEEKEGQHNSSAEHKVDNTDGLENNRELTSNMELMSGYVLLCEYYDEDFINTTEKMCEGICPLGEKPICRNPGNKFEVRDEAHDVTGFFDEEYLNSLD